MKSIKLFLMPGVVALFCAVSCMDSIKIIRNSGTNKIVVDTTEFVLTSVAQTLTIPYTAPSNVEVSTSVNWLSTEVGDDTITLIVTANTTNNDRSATVTLSYPGASDVSLTVTQVVPIITVDSPVSVAYTEGSTATFSYSVSGAIEGDVVTAIADGEVVTVASVNSVDYTVTVTVSENTDYETRTGTVTLMSTYAKVLVVSVVQDGGPYTTSYESFLGTWEVTDINNTTATIVISQNVYASSYTVRGWQFDNTSYTLGSLWGSLGGFTSNTDLSLAFTAYYNSDTQELEFNTHYFTSATYYYEQENITFTGDFKLTGGVYHTENKNGTELLRGDYHIANVSLSSPSNGDITALDRFISMEYGLLITSPTNYSSSYVSFDKNLGNFFPCTITKISSSTSSTFSAKSSEKVVPVLNETTVVE